LCVAARPSLDLSLLHAADTRKSFYTATVKRQPYSTTGLIVAESRLGVTSSSRVINGGQPRA
jgi:hypothetical protein